MSESNRPEQDASAINEDDSPKAAMRAFLYPPDKEQLDRIEAKLDELFTLIAARTTEE